MAAVKSSLFHTSVAFVHAAPPPPFERLAPDEDVVEGDDLAVAEVVRRHVVVGHIIGVEASQTPDEFPDNLAAVVISRAAAIAAVQTTDARQAATV
jgi:hypothetical protein